MSRENKNPADLFETIYIWKSITRVKSIKVNFANNKKNFSF